MRLDPCIEFVSESIPYDIQFENSRFDERCRSTLIWKQLGLLEETESHTVDVLDFVVRLQVAINVVLDDQVTLENTPECVMLMSQQTLEAGILLIEVSVDLLPVRLQFLNYVLDSFDEPPRDCRRLFLLRGWSHDKDRKVLARGTGACSADGVRERA